MMTEIHTEEIMKQIREEIRKQNPENIPSFDEITQSPDAFRMQSQVTLYPPIEGNFLTKVIKKLIRKLMTFQLIPIMTEQNSINLQMANEIIKLQEQLSQTEQNLTAMQNQIRMLEAENKKLKDMQL